MRTAAGSFRHASGLRPHLRRLGALAIFVAICGGGSARGQELDWVAAAGGAGTDQGQAVAVDASGNTFVTGSFTGTAAFAPGASLTSAGLEDIFVARYDASGTLVWVRQAGGTATDKGLGVAVDAAGNVYVTGFFNGTATFNSATTLTSSGGPDLFVAKYDSTGALVWVKQEGGNSPDVMGRGIAVDLSGNVYVTGSYLFTATFRGSAIPSAGGYDAFLARYDSTGTLGWVKTVGGADADIGYAVAVDPQGNAYVAGSFVGTATFTPNVWTLTSAGLTDVFVAKVTPNANVEWVRSAGGTSNDQAQAIEVDGLGNSYIGGIFGGSAAFGLAAEPTRTVLTSAGSNDIFMAKYTSAGALHWARGAGGQSSDSARGIATDASGKSYLTGHFTTAATFGAGEANQTVVTSVVPGSYDLYFATFDANGSLLDVQADGGTDADFGNDIAVDGAGGIVIAGSYQGNSIFGGASTRTLASAGGDDVFVAKYIAAAAPSIFPVADATIVREQGSPGGAPVVIATVEDAHTAVGDLVVTVQEPVPPGLTLTTPLNTNGAITSVVSASCAAPAGSNVVRLQVSDGARIVAANLSIDVLANTPPKLGTYADIAVIRGFGAAVYPTDPPFDNGAIDAMTGVPSAGFSGTLSVDLVKGGITITNASPVGAFTVTVTATDNCGATTATTFRLDVKEPAAPSSTTLSVSATDVVQGRPVRLTATIDVPASIKSDGEVKFWDGSVTPAKFLGSALVAWDPASPNRSSVSLLAVLPPGAHLLFATYAGNFDVVPSQSSTVNVTVATKAGIVRAWGNNQEGQLGDGTRSTRTNPVPVRQADGTPLRDVVALEGGIFHSVALQRDGTVRTWGYNYLGQLGDGTTALNQFAPVQVQAPGGVPLSGIVGVAAGNTHTVAVGQDGSVWAWGNNHAGQLGSTDPTITSSNRALLVTLDGKPLGQIVAVAAGNEHTLALAADGTVWGWGYNQFGELGDGTRLNRSRPGQVRLADGRLLTDVVAIGAGANHSLALRADGTAWAWGDNWAGQLGDGSTTLRLQPVQIRISATEPLAGVLAIAAGEFHSVARDRDGFVWTWGLNDAGQLGDGTNTNRSFAAKIVLADGWPFDQTVEIAAGGNQSMALLDNGEVRTWGANWGGQLGDGTTLNRSEPIQVLLAPGTPAHAAAIAMGSFHGLLAAPELAALVAPGTLDFGAVPLGSTGTQQIVTLSNVGEQGLGFLSADVTGTPPTFAVAGTTCASGSTIPSGGACTIDVTFLAPVLGDHAATLRIHTTAPDSPHLVPLTGRAVSALRITAPGAVTGSEGVPVPIAGRVDVDPGRTAQLSADLTGDGTFESVVPVAGDGTFVFEPMFADDGQYGVQLRAIDDAGNAVTTVVAVAVVNMAPSIQPLANQVLTLEPPFSAGVPVIFAGTFADSGADSWTATVEYGDGAAGALTVGADRSFRTPAPFHQFTSAGVYTVTVRVLDDEGGTGSASFTVTVLGLPPSAIVTAGHCCGTLMMGGFAVNAQTGAVSQKQVINESPNAPGGTRIVAAHPRGRFVYVGVGPTLRGYTIDANVAALTPIAGASASYSGNEVRSLVVDGSGRFLYVATDGGTVRGYAINADTGALTSLAQSWNVSTGASGLATDAAGRYLYVTGSRVAGFAVASTGTLTPLPGSPYGSFYGSAIAMDPRGRFVYQAGSGIVGHRVLPADGSLVGIAGMPVAPTTYYTSISFDGTGAFLYALRGSGPLSIDAYVVDALSGSLTAVPGSPFAIAGGYPYGIAGEASGQFIYTAEANNGVRAYAINRASGALTFVNGSGPTAHGLAVVPASGSPGAALTSLEILPANYTILSSALGVKQQLVAVGHYSDGTRRFLTSSVQWSSDAVIATISNTLGTNGLVTANAYGTTTVTATWGGLTANTLLHVVSPPLTGVVVAPTTVAIPQGRAVQLRATASYGDGSSQDVTSQATWTSPDPAVATVVQGLVTGVGATTGTTVAAALGNFQASATIQVTSPQGSPDQVTRAPAGIVTAGHCCGTLMAASFAAHAQTGAVTRTQLINESPNAPGGTRVVTVDPQGRFAYMGVGPTLRGYAVDANAMLLTPIAGASASYSGNEVRALAVDGSGRFLYVATYDNTIRGYLISAAGGLTPMPAGMWTVGTGASGLATDPNGRYLYAIGSKAAGYAIDQATGFLTPLSGSSYGATYGAAAAVDPRGRFLYQAGNGVSGYRIQNDGSLVPLGGAPGSNSYVSISFDGTGTFLYALRSSGQQSIDAYAVDPLSGALTLVPGSPFAIAGGYPYGIAGEASGGFIYTAEANEGVRAYAIDPVTGALTFINGSQPTAHALAVVTASAITDTTAPTLSATVAPATNAAGWHNATVLASTNGVATVTLQAQEETGGSGMAS